MPPSLLEIVQDSLPLPRNFYHITVLQSEPSRTVKRITVDGIVQPNEFIALSDDRQDHQVEMELG